MSTENDKPVSVRDHIISAVNQVADKRPDDDAQQLTRDVVNRNEKVRDAASSRLEPKEPDRSEKQDDRQDTRSGESDTRKEIRANLRTQKETTENADAAPVRKAQGDKEDKQADAGDDKGQARENEKQERSQPKAGPRNLLPKEVQAEIDNLPEASKTFMLRQTKEFNELKAARGREQYLDDVHKIFEPVLPKLKEVGATPAQFVDRMIRYAVNLGNPQTQVGTLLNLCQDYGIDLVGVVDRLSQQQSEFSSLPPAVQEKLTQMEAALQGYQQQQYQTQQIQSQSQQELNSKAQGTIIDWADRAGAQHISEPTVKATMANLLANHMDSYKGDGFGGVNLDKLYRDACTVLGVNDPFQAKPQRQQQQRSQQPNRQGGQRVNPKDTSPRASIREALAQLKAQEHRNQR